MIDVAKGIGITLVVYGHVARGVVHAGIAVDKQLYQLVDDVIYSFHMPLFFFISGLFVFQSLIAKGRPRFLLGRVATLLYPYVVWSILQGGVEIAFSGYTNGVVGYSEVFSLLWRPRAQFWYIYALFFMHVFCSLVLFNRGSINLALLFFFALFLYFFSYYGNFDVAFLKQLGSNFIFLVLGLVVSWNDWRRFECSLLGLCVSFCIFVLSQYTFHCVLGLSYVDGGWLHLLNAVVSIYFVMFLSGWVGGYVGRCLAFLGASSMIIYLLHIFAGSGFRIFLLRLGCDGAFVHVFFGTVAAIFMPLAFVSWFGKERFDVFISMPKKKLSSII